MKLDFSNRPVNIDSTFRCTLECPRCLRQVIRNKGEKVPGQDMPWGDFIKITNYFKTIYFCGDISDPIFNPLLIDMLKYCYENDIDVSVKTAASHKPISWYVDAFTANPDTHWTFGIDGLPKDSHKYRINQDGVKLFNIIKMGQEDLHMKKLHWEYIVFKYNEDDIEKAKELAKVNGIFLEVVQSGRWNLPIDELRPTNPEFFVRDHDNPGITPITIPGKVYPKCLDKKEFTYSATGFIFPCCWYDDALMKIKIKSLSEDPLLKALNQEHLKVENNNTIEDVVYSKEWINFFEELKTNPPNLCKKRCSEPLNKLYRYGRKGKETFNYRSII